MSPSGVLVVDKPSGPTSHDVVAAARRLLRTRAVGHAGTLDPLASGVLLLLVGEATKLTPWLTAGTKEYRATIVLGRATDTLDAEGETTEEAPLAAGQPDPAALAAALEVERLRRSQVPPAVSAISVGGVRAHRLARRGLAPELPPRDVEVGELVLERAEGCELVVRVRASKGYYVRSLARDLGESLGIPAHLGALRRLASGPFRIEAALAWPPVRPPDLLTVEAAAARVIPLCSLSAEAVVRARQGKPLGAGDFDRPPPEGDALWADPEGRAVAIGGPAEPGAFRVRRGFPGRAPRSEPPPPGP